MNNDMEYVVGLGEALWDKLPAGKKLGGAPANFAYHAGQFGLRSCVVSAVGDDALGHELLDAVGKCGIEHRIQTVGHATGEVNVTLDDAGIPQYDIREDVAWDNIPFNEELQSLAARTRAVCFGSLAQRNDVSRHTIARFIESMPRRDDTLIVFDINLRQNYYSREVAEQSLNLCNILKINDEELVVVSGMLGYGNISQEEACRRLLHDYGLRVVILTCGVNGSHVYTADGSSFLPTPTAEVADTVGAGDSFTGAFVASLLMGKSVVEAHRKAVDVSAYVCSQHGAMPRLPQSLTRR